MNRSTLRKVLIAVALAVGGAPAVASAAPVVISPNKDTAPGIGVDASGTAHVAWGSVVGTTHSVTYCRVPRGATACTGTKTLPSPSNNSLFGLTQVLVKDQLVVILESVCCGAPEGTFMWKSTDGGTNFGAATKVMTESPGYSPYRSEINQAGTGAVVNNNAGTRAGFVAFDGSTAAQQPALVGDDSILGAGDVGWLNSTTPFSTQHGYLTNELFTKPFDSTKTGYNNAANWLPATKIGDKVTQSAIATGPAGAFIAGLTTVDNQFGQNEITVQRVNDAGVASAPIAVIDETTPVHDPSDLDFVEDAGGRLHLIWTDAGFDGRVYYEWSNDGVTWSPPELIQHDPGVGSYDLRLAIAPDGGGWVVSHSNNDGPVAIAPIAPKGDSVPPPRVKPGPPPVACPTKINVTKDAPAVVRSGGCFTGKAPVYKTTGSIRVGGIDIVSAGSGTLTVNTSAHTVTSSGSAKYEVRAGATVLAKSAIHWDLNAPIKIDGLSKFGVHLFGLGVTGKADLWFTKGEGRIQINLDMPSPLDSVNANTVLRATMNDGLIVDGFSVNGKNVPIGPVQISEFALAYAVGADTLEGNFAMKLPPGASDNVKGGLGLQGGKFKHAELEIGPGVPPLPLPLWAAPPVTLNRIAASASNDAKGFSMAGKVAIVAGGEIAGAAVVGVDGTLALFVPASRSYAQIRAQGDVKIVGVPLGGGFVQIRTDGPLTFGGSMGIDFDIVDASFSTAGGVNLSNGDFYASGKAHVGVSLVIVSGSLDASSIVSSVGVAACGAIKGKVPKTGLSTTIEVGYQKPWGKDSELGGCEIDKYVPASLKGGSAFAPVFGAKPFDPLARAAQATGQQFALKSGRLAGVKVVGTGGRPGFTLAGPKGRSIVVPANMTDGVAEGSIVAIPVGPDTIEVQVKNPKGSWTIAPEQGSPAIARVLSAGVLPEPKVSGSVRRRGARRVLTVKASNLGSQSLIVRERLPGGAANEIGRVTKNGVKRFSFRPALAAGGKRQIEAVVLAGTKVAGTRRITSYVAPKPARLAAPRAVKVTRKRAGVAAMKVSWRKVTGAASYRVLVTAPDGRKEYFNTPAKKRSVTVPSVTYDDKVTVRVQAMPKFGKPGTLARATSKPVKLKAAKKKPAKKKSKKKSKK